MAGKLRSPLPGSPSPASVQPLARHPGTGPQCPPCFSFRSQGPVSSALDARRPTRPRRPSSASSASPCGTTPSLPESFSRWGPEHPVSPRGCPTLGHKELRSGQAVFATCRALTCLFPLQPDVHPGNCWAFQGPQGFAVVRLSARIRPSAVTLEHVPKALSPNSTISSAPKDFAIFVSVPPGSWGSLSRI